MQAAADIIRKQLNIKNRILVNSDESLFLYAECEDGNFLYDEADIVEHNSKNRIKDIGFFKDSEKVTHSTFNEETIESVNNADIIIFSSGTQWSSLIPTYKSYNGDLSFKDLILASKADKCLVMNSTNDKDMIDSDANDILNILERYLNMHDIKTVIDKDAVEGLNTVNGYNNISFSLSGNNDKHNGNLLIDSILKDYYGYPTNKDLFIFDWDDTIKARKNKHLDISKSNIKKVKNIDSIIVTGNTHHGIDMSRVYADAGINLYKDGTFKYCVNKSLSIDKYFIDIKKIINDIGFDDSKIQNRGNTCISIKPLDNEYRKAICRLLNILIPENLVAKINGNTTIDIMNKETDKIFSVKEIINNNRERRVYYIGDEYEEGNDSTIYNLKNDIGLEKFIKVNSVFDTKLFLKLIEE